MEESNNLRIQGRHVAAAALWLVTGFALWLAAGEATQASCRADRGSGSWAIAIAALSGLATFPSLWSSWTVAQRVAVSVVVGAVVGAGVFSLGLLGWIQCAN